jgi:DnaJ-class molecular chaperone
MSIMAKDYYKILGVARSVDTKEIKAAYRRLARKYHPDVNPNDKAAEARFKEVSEAYDVLSDPEKRKAYDQFGENWNQVGPGAEDFMGGGEAGFEDIFKNFFGGFADAEPAGRRAGGARVRFHHVDAAAPRDIEKSIEITLEEADTGTRRTLTYQTMDAQSMRGGVSQVPTTKKVDVDIPAGTPDGAQIRLRGRGAAGIGGRAGDLLLTVKWRAHDRFRLINDRLETDLDVPMVTATLGGEVKLATLRGKTLTLTITPGTCSGKVLSLRGQGITQPNGSRGDLYARVRIVVPSSITPEQKRLLEQFRQIEEAKR